MDCVKQATGHNNDTELHLAARRGDLASVKRILSDIDTQIADVFGEDNSNAEAAKILRSVGIEVNDTDRLAIVPELLQHANRECLMKKNQSGYDAVNIASFCGANELNQPQDDLRKTLSVIKNYSHIQLELTRRTDEDIDNISKELRKLESEQTKNATTSMTVVAALFVTMAFAAIFTVLRGYAGIDLEVLVSRISFKIFFIFNTVAVFTFIAVLMLQIMLNHSETKAEKKAVEIINKLMLVATVSISVALIFYSYIVVGRKDEWMAVLVSAVGGFVMASVIGCMIYHVLKSKLVCTLRKKEKLFAKDGSKVSEL